MPPKNKFSKDEIINAALDVVRAGGKGALTARAIGTALGSSPKVIFGLFQNMEELHAAVMDAANRRYQEFLQEDMSSGKYPPYKGSGIGYIRFASQEPSLFKMLFMRDRSHEIIREDLDSIQPLLRIIQENTGMGAQEAYLFHLEMWVYVHGIASMIATGYLEWDWELVSKMLTDCYEGIRTRFPGQEVK